MVIFSFGRENHIRVLRGTEAVSVFGFIDNDRGHESIRGLAAAPLANPFERAPGP